MAASVSEPLDIAGAGGPPPQMRGLLRYTEALASELFAFQREAFPTRRPDWVEPRWRWMFLASAARLAVEPMVWLYRMKGRIVAQQGAIAVRLQTPAGECTTGWFVETMALEEVRGKAIGSMVVAKAVQDLPFNLSLGQTEQMRELQYRLGWQRVAPLRTLMFVLNGQAVVQGKVSPLLKPAAGAVLSVRQQARYLRGHRGARGPLVRDVPRFGAAHDALWARASRHYPVAVVRDASYLNWKYVDQPGQSFVRIELVEGVEVRAAAVLGFSEPDAAYRYRRAWLTEIVVPLDDPELIWRTFDAVRTVCRTHRVDALLFDVINEALVTHAVAFGFTHREPTRFLLIAPGETPSAMSQPTLDPANWLVTRGDSDLDRPW